ncbi:glycosyltransferase family 2 protein [Bizionia myxarmorum]|uniref:Glycosyltransferase family 2 protein n=1 Tax=Bizionia myxarmorum TaxID=291186 RepID=A0A5D0R683_9FLAO|nr:glycosyltransferase family 2 protein [Bizionia myxarmorum]TYB76943.1 glycosyltransferase family 2 protein [Bizionia myxarmorum]
MKLSVIILNYNVRYFLELCLKSVEKSLVGLYAEIIVVDNQSADASCDMVKESFPNVILIENPSNAGFSKGNNLGVKIAQGEYLCILNPDTIVAEDTFKILLDFADKQDKLGIVGCRLMDGTGKFLPESKRNVPKPAVALKKLLGNPDSYYANQIGEYEIGEAPIFVGAFMLLKKAVYDAVGGFDEDYFMYGEDIDLSYKVLKAGYTNYYNGSTTIVHYKGESTLKDANYAKRFYGAMQIFYKKHFRSNIIFNGIVWLGIRGAYMMRSEPEVVSNKHQSYVFYTQETSHILETLVDKPITLRSKVEAVDPFTEVIFDANSLSYKAIFQYITVLKGSEGISFKILPNGSNFIIGSNCSKNRGEIQVLTKI